MAAQQFRKKSVVIEAAQWDGTAESATPIIEWVLGGGGTARYHDAEPPRMHSVHCRCDGRGIIPGPNRHAVACDETEPRGPGVPTFIAIDTLEGTMSADINDWIIRGVAGEFYPCKPDIFTATYGPVDEIMAAFIA